MRARESLGARANTSGSRCVSRSGDLSWSCAAQGAPPAFACCKSCLHVKYGSRGDAVNNQYQQLQGRESIFIDCLRGWSVLHTSVGDDASLEHLTAGYFLRARGDRPGSCGPERPRRSAGQEDTLRTEDAEHCRETPSRSDCACNMCISYLCACSHATAHTPAARGGRRCSQQGAHILSAWRSQGDLISSVTSGAAAHGRRRKPGDARPAKSLKPGLTPWR